MLITIFRFTILLQQRIHRTQFIVVISNVRLHRDVF